MMKPYEVRAIYDDHCRYWRDLRPEMRKLRNLTRRAPTSFDGR